MAAPLMPNNDDDQRLRDIQRNYVDILDDDGGKFTNAVKSMLSQNSPRLIVNINSIRAKNPERARAILNNFFEEMTAFQRALKEFVGSIDPEEAKARTDFHIGLEGSFGANHLNPRTLTSSHLNKLTCIEGIVTKCSGVNPKILKSVHYCPNTNKTIERQYSDLVSLEAFPSSAAYPTQDEDGNPLQTEFGLSLYKDHQTLTIQELPEKAPTGQLPRSVEVICENDLVDKCKPGDRVQIVGSFRCLPNKQQGFTSGSFRSVIIANNIISMSKDVDTMLSAEDIRMITKFIKSEKNVFETIARSIAPSIHGHEYVKRALLCQLLGGIEKILPNGSRLRGDINVMLIGDPSVAKSQLLRYVLSAAGRSVTTTGRGSSGVGLTAAVTTDQDTGERRLEAGAMVLADRGIVCIDEFDKMTDMDRTAIHEVMEQGRVTISKAGIHARLNARCSVLAAANPVYGRYDPHKTPMENIGLQDSLLSRFDLLFVLLDTIDVEKDKKIADHVVGIHRYRSSKESDGMVTDITGSGISEFDTHRTQKDTKTTVWDKPNKLLHGAAPARQKFVNADFIRKYISYVKEQVNPVLTEKACELIGEEYSNIRSQVMEGTDLAKTQPITARCLETMIRLATAHAKARMSKTVDKKDAELAIELVTYAYFKKVLRKERKRKQRDQDSDGEEIEDSDDEVVSEDEQDDQQPNTSSSTVQQPKPKRVRQKSPEPSSNQQSVSSEPVKINDNLLTEFKKKLSDLFGNKQHLEMDTIVENMVENNVCSAEEVMACVEAMTNENRVMLSAGILYWI